MTKLSLSKRLISYLETLILEFKDVINQLKLLKNPNVAEILDILEKKGARTISQLQEEINLTYNNTFLNVKKLEEVGLVETKKDYKAQGRPVFVDLTERMKKFLKSVN